MTNEQMNEVIQDHCDYVAHNNCDKCAIEAECASCSGDFLANPSRCEAAYNILMGDEDIVNHPNHYTHGGMECIDEMIMVFGKQTVMHFCLCNAWKYRYRAVFKNGEEDIKKSHWYMAKYKELRDGNYQ